MLTPRREGQACALTSPHATLTHPLLSLDVRLCPRHERVRGKHGSERSCIGETQRIKEMTVVRSGGTEGEQRKRLRVSGCCLSSRRAHPHPPPLNACHLCSQQGPSLGVWARKLEDHHYSNASLLRLQSQSPTGCGCQMPLFTQESSSQGPMPPTATQAANPLQTSLTPAPVFLP